MLVYLKNVIFFVFLPFIKNLIFLIPLISAAIPVWAKDNRPAFNSSRYKENYIFLQDRNKKIDLFDSIKYIPFNNTKTSFLTIGGETRQHFELIDNNNWGKGNQDSNGYYLQRYLAHADLHLGDHTRIFAQLMSGIQKGRSGGSRAIDEDWLDLNQAFVDHQLFENKYQNFKIRLGRQEITFGSRRFLNYRERPNIRLSHDAVMGIYNTDNLNISIFGARPVTIDQGYFDNQSKSTLSFWGLYGTRQNLSSKFSFNIDLYYLGLYNRDSTYDQGQEKENRHTTGTRLWGKEKNFDYNFEFLYQFGTFGLGSIYAYALASDTGYTIQLSKSYKVRLSLRADIYSGDDDPKDADLNSFNPFFPKGKHISQLASNGLINQRDLHPRITFNIGEHWVINTSVLFIWRDSLNDGIYSIGSQLLRKSQSSRARYVGTQPELEVKYIINRYIDLKGIFVHFNSGKFLKETPPSNDINYFGSMLTFRF